MWVFSKTGFVSIVAHRDDPDALMVRGRTREDVENYVDATGPPRFHGPASVGEVYETPDGDYRWRVVMSRGAATAGVAGLCMAIDYDNFKDACHELNEPDRDMALMRVWSAMNNLQRNRHPLPGEGRTQATLFPWDEQ